MIFKWIRDGFISKGENKAMKKGVEINGVVYALKGNVNHDEFLDAFIDFVESKGWYFGGGTKQVDEEGNVRQIKSKSFMGGSEI
jgi:uncharacterized protein YggL (DUF469 family)